MRLKKIELFGFKSFADKTEIIFDEGVTCIVGPNGCGKSNISDAVRWVLGERSAKLLRGTKMDDVIFNGTEFRKPVAFSEVSLTLDNQDRGLPIDYQEVILTRRLHRTGVSEYFLNRTACRLKDIQDLILDTGIGSNSYSMIEQGRIDYILSADAEERRFLIEEAAGISKYNVKKEEAIRKLEHTEENRLRLLDIIHEVQKNIQYAERQARKASRYREELEKLKNLQIRKAFHDLKALTAQKDAVNVQLSQLHKGLDENESQTAAQRRQSDSIQEMLTEVLDRFREGEASRYKIQSKWEQTQQEIRFNQEKKIETAARLAHVQSEKKQLESHLKENAEELRRKNAELARTQEEQDLAQNLHAESEQSFKAAQAQFDAAKGKLENLKPAIFQAAADTVKLRNDYQRLEAFLQTSTPQRRRQEATEERVREQAQQMEARKAAAEEELASLNLKLSQRNREKENLDREIAGAEAEIEGIKNKMLNCQQQLEEKRARLDLLLELDKTYSAHEAALLEETEGLKSEWATSLRKILTARPGFEWALEAVLGSFSSSLIVQDVASAEILLRRIQERRPSSMGLLIQGLQPPPTAASFPGADSDGLDIIPISDAIQIERGYEALLRPFFENAFIVDGEKAGSLAELLPLAANRKLITASGLTVGPHGRILYKNQDLSGETNQFKRAEEIGSLKEKFEQAQSALDQESASEAALLQHHQVLRVKRESLEAERLDLLVSKESFEPLVEEINDRLSGFQRELELIHFESQELERHQSETAVRQNGLRSELETAERKEKSLLAEQETLLREMESVELKKNTLLQQLIESKTRYSNLVEKCRILGESLRLIQDHEIRSSERLGSLENERILSVEREALLQEAEKRLLHEHQQLLDQQREADIALGLVRQEKEHGEKEMASIQSELAAAGRRQQEVQHQMHQAEIRIMDIGFQEKNISDRLLQIYRIELSKLNPDDFAMPPDQSVEEIETQISELGEKVESLGTVNLLAVEEYEELKKRCDFLLAQQKDLEEARQQLLETIRKINRTTKGLFEETFAHVQKAFQEYYQTLFRGGHAKLVLLDEQNPLESGIDIVVRPPGKKLQNISLLSGGEKALTAIALLFALFRIKPSPFCVLDEVDAPLDEANIDRFLSVLRSFLATTQFIIVTHNRKTIAMGDSLYGVTMQEPGISKLVSVKISQEPERAPAPSELESAPAEEQISI